MRKNFIESNQEINNLSRELQKTNAKLIRLNALENEFLGMAAHDLRNPIGIVYQYSELLLEDTEKILNNEQIEMLKIIIYQAILCWD